MEKFFLIIEVSSYLLALYLILKKNELAIMYVPVLVFSHNIIEPAFSASVYYSIVSIVIIACILKNGSFYTNNAWALLLICYFILLLTRSSDLAAIRPHLFSVFWLLVSIPLIAAVYKKHSVDTILGELTLVAFLVLVLFVANVLMSTINHYSPTRMYGITSGILYGNIYAAGFNILSVALFVVTLKLSLKRNLGHLLLVILAYTFILLSLRRSVMLVSTIGIAIIILTAVFKKEAGKLILPGGLALLCGFMIYTNTGFKDEIKERYELRRLNERALESEPRFAEYRLLYNDMFVYNRYSPVIGFGLFNSSSNYGKAVFESRTLHGDLPSIVHSSGFLGLFFYIMMIITTIRSAMSAASSATDRSVILFAVTALLVFTITGRFTETGSMQLIFLVLLLPLSRKSFHWQNLKHRNPARGHLSYLSRGHQYDN